MEHKIEVESNVGIIINFKKSEGWYLFFAYIQNFQWNNSYNSNKMGQ
jgi:hypothetical protein